MFPYKWATIDYGFEFVNDIESYFSFVIKCFFMGVGFLSHGACFVTDLRMAVQLSQTAEPKDYIYSVACEVWLWVSDMMLLWWLIVTSKTHNQITQATL